MEPVDRDRRSQARGLWWRSTPLRCQDPARRDVQPISPLLQPATAQWTSATCWRSFRAGGHAC